jgi:hypothetical protein
MYFPSKISHFLENGGINDQSSYFQSILKYNLIICGEKPVIITNSINKTVLLPFCDNKCDREKQKSVIN